MCNRYRASASEAKLAKRFGVPVLNTERGRLPCRSCFREPNELVKPVHPKQCR
jgi:hypothetical protein